MEPAQDTKSSDVFPMAIACTGCATRYKIDKPRGFTCPHCGNHIQVLEDGKVEIVPKKIMDREIEEIAEMKEPSSPEMSIRDTIEEEKRILDSIRKPDLEAGRRGAVPGPEESVMEISAARKKQVRGGPVERGEKADGNAAVEDTDIDDTEMVDEVVERKKELDEEIRREEAQLEKLRKGRELLERKKREATRIRRPTSISELPGDGTEEIVSGPKRSVEEGPDAAPGIAKEPPAVPAMKELPGVEGRGREGEGGKREKLPPPVVPSYYGKKRKAIRLPFDGVVKRTAALALGLVMLILLAIIAYSIFTAEDFTVQMLNEKMGDKGTYNVEGRIWVSSPDGISTGNGLVQDLKINLNGQMWYQINETAVEKDGFGIERETLDKYLFQNLKLSGSVELLGSKTEISDAGSLETKSSSYTCLISNETVQTKIFNDLDLDILSYFTLRSIDHGIYYPTGDNVESYNLFELRGREYSLGDEGDFAGGQLRWSAEKKEKVNKWDCLKLHITENSSDAKWREFSGDIWVANECSLPVKVHVHTRVDSTQLSPTQKLIMSFFTSSDGFLEVDYTATMIDFTRGDRSIPWDTFGDDPSVTERKDVQFDDDWTYAPVVRNDSLSFDPDFSPETAAEYAVNHSSELRSYVERHEDDVYIVDGKYSKVNDSQYWQLLFSYRESGLNVNANAYNITIEKNGTNIKVFSDPGEESINNPSNSRNEIEQALNLADSEGIFANMSYLTPLFAAERIDFTNDAKGKVTFEIQNNQLHTGLSLSSSFNPLIQNTVPAGYGYYLQREREEGSKYYFEEGMIDAQNGRIIYEVDHYQSGQF